MFLPAWFSTKKSAFRKDIPRALLFCHFRGSKVHRSYYQRLDSSPPEEKRSPPLGNAQLAAGGKQLYSSSWLKDGTNITTIARDAKVSPATGYRYIHEALTVVAEKSPTLIEALQQVTDKDEPFICLDGTLIHTDRIAQRNPKNRRHLWYS